MQARDVDEGTHCGALTTGGPVQQPRGDTPDLTNALQGPYCVCARMQLAASDDAARNGRLPYVRVTASR